MNNEVNWMQQGWECPKCGAVMSPHTDCCVNCRGNKDGFSITAIGDPVPTTDNNWTGYPPINDPSSTCSSSSPLDPPYVLTNEAREIKNSGFQKKSCAVGAFTSVFNAAGGPPELGFDNSGYKENPEEQWERYQLNV